MTAASGDQQRLPKYIYRNGARYYDLGDGNAYVGVTSVLQVIRKPFLEKWRGDHGNEWSDEYTKAAGDRGTGIHAAVEGWLTTHGYPQLNDEDDTGVEESKAVMAFEDWYYKNCEEMLAAEYTCQNTKYEYAGTADIIVRLKTHDDWTLVDLKTGKSFPEEAPLQLAAYRMALAEEGIQTNGSIVLHLRQKTLTWREIDLQPSREDERAFLAALYLWRWKNERQ